MEFTYGHLLDVGPTGGLNQYHFQNYAVGQNVGIYSFLPFGFSGAVASLQGDNLNATLQFANAEITRNFVVEGLGRDRNSDQLKFSFRRCSGKCARPSPVSAAGRQYPIHLSSQCVVI